MPQHTIERKKKQFMQKSITAKNTSDYHFMVDIYLQIVIIYPGSPLRRSFTQKGLWMILKIIQGDNERSPRL